MEFFELWSSFIQALGYPSVEYYYGIRPLSPYAVLGIAAGVYALLYVFRAIGLFTMAKKQGKRGLLWCAFLPFASTFLMGELAGEWKLGGKRVKHIGAYAMAAEILYCACAAVVCVIITRALLGIEGSVTPESSGSTGLVVDRLDLPDRLYMLYSVFGILATVFQFLLLVPFVFLYLVFFRRYAPLSYVWMVVVCAIFPVVTAFLIFAYRNRAPVDYERFMQARMEQMRRARSAQYGPYGPQGPYGQQGQGAARPPEDPFGEFSSGKEEKDPFGEFSAGKGKDDPFGEFSDNDRKDGGAH